MLGLQNPGYSPEPWTPVDSIAWLKAMAWDLRSNLGDEIDRALLATALPPEEVARLHPELPVRREAHDRRRARSPPRRPRPASTRSTVERCGQCRQMPRCG